MLASNCLTETPGRRPQRAPEATLFVAKKILANALTRANGASPHNADEKLGKSRASCRHAQTAFVSAPLP